jgi:hypothetical protein
MLKVTSKDKDLLLTLVNVVVTLGAMLAVMAFIGELHGLIATVFILIVQTSFLTRRVVALERELRISHEPPHSESSKVVEKTAEL